MRVFSKTQCDGSPCASEITNVLTLGAGTQSRILQTHNSKVNTPIVPHSPLCYGPLSPPLSRLCVLLTFTNTTPENSSRPASASRNMAASHRACKSLSPVHLSASDLCVEVLKNFLIGCVNNSRGLKGLCHFYRARTWETSTSLQQPRKAGNRKKP